MDEKLPKRKNIRLQHYDYSSAGYYYITICTRNRKHSFGSIIDGKIVLSKYGEIAERNINSIPKHMSMVYVDKYVVMPNHVHILLVVNAKLDVVGARYIVAETCNTLERTPCMASLQAKSKQTISKTIQQYKASVSRDSGVRGLWQARFNDHVIRDEADYLRIWQYIDNNSAKWAEDEYFTD